MDTAEATKKLAEIYSTGESDTIPERQAEDWGRADYSLDAAYQALDAEPHPEATADDLSRGKHPIQREADRRWQEVWGQE